MPALRTGVLLVTVAGIAAAASWLAMSPSQPSATEAPAPLCGGFDFPVGAPDSVGYYDAQPFGENDHLGNDWNGLGGNNTDLGDPVFAVADGMVIDARDQGEGWGNVVRVMHPCACELQSLYAHLETMTVAPGTLVSRGDRIGTIGTANGHYRAHLHFELRSRSLPLGGGYSAQRDGFVDATQFIRGHRPVVTTRSSSR